MGPNQLNFDVLTEKDNLRFLFSVSLWLQEGLPFSFWRGKKNADTFEERERN